MSDAIAPIERLCKCGQVYTAKRRVCDTCASAIAERVRLTRNERLSFGLCMCGKPVAEGTAICNACRDRRAASLRARTAKRASEGLCRCGRQPEPGRKFCGLCEQRIHRDYQIRTEKRAHGQLCKECCKATSDGRAYCDACRAIRNSRSVTLLRERKSLGLCRCGKPAMDGISRCANCNEKNTAYAAAFRARRSARKSAIGLVTESPRLCECGNPAFLERYLCADCINAKRTQRRNENLAKGRCRCGAERAVGIKNCQNCQDKLNIRRQRARRPPVKHRTSGRSKWPDSLRERWDRFWQGVGDEEMCEILANFCLQVSDGGKV